MMIEESLLYTTMAPLGGPINNLLPWMLLIIGGFILIRLSLFVYTLLFKCIFPYLFSTRALVREMKKEEIEKGD
jgi:hypothetical protein